VNVYANLDFTDQFLAEFADGRFSAAERAQILKALRLLDSDERHPSLRLHALRGDMAGQWSVSASSTLRLTFERRPGERKVLKSVSRHYDR
jgi:mRNA-degrading endonuclease YafQ of YafQ-DinJ toxin-antitoxin module